MLKRQPWRGNVRELKNFIYRMALLARKDVIDTETLGPMIVKIGRNESDGGEGAPSVDAAVSRWLAETEPAPGTVYHSAMAAFERPLFAQVLKGTGGNQLRAAQHLGINRNTLRKRLSELALDPEDFTGRE